MNTGKLWQRIVNAFAPGTIRAVDDTGPVLKVQVQIGYLETTDQLPVLQQFGFASVPPVGSDVAISYISGDRSNGIGVATGHQATRFKNKAAGESVVFNAFGMSVYLSQGGIVIGAGNAPVTITGATVINIDAATSINLQAPLVATSAILTAGNGVTGVYSGGAGHSIIVQNGIVIAIT